MKAPMTVQDCIRNLLGGVAFTAADVGARGDIPFPWIVLDGIAEFVSFEADPVACERLKRTYAERGNGHLYRIVPHALSANGGMRTLYRTASPSGSSFFDPDIPLLREYVNRDYLYPISTIDVVTYPARTMFEESGAADSDLIKLDIQGCELEVLQSLSPDILGSAVMIELEASVLKRNSNYPTFCDIHEFMTAQGFELLDMWPDRVQRTRNGSRRAFLEGIFGVYIDSPSISPRIWEVDMIYFRTPANLNQQLNIAKLFKLAIAFCLYGFFSEALCAIEWGEAHDRVSANDAERAKQSVVCWHRLTRYRYRYSLGAFARLYRWLLHHFELPAITTRADYIHHDR